MGSNHSLATKAFEKHPMSFLSQNVVTYLSPVQSGRRAFENGDTCKVALHPTVDHTAFSIIPALDSEYGIPGYWVEMRKSIEVSAYSGPCFIFTPELTGCSVYVRYNSKNKTISVYHHYRDFSNTKPGNSEIVQDNDGRYIVSEKTKHYDDVLSWEQYGVDLNWQNVTKAAHLTISRENRTNEELSHLRPRRTTSFLYRDNQDAWYFVYQRYSLDVLGRSTRTGSYTNFQLDHHWCKRICGVPEKIRALIRVPEPAHIQDRNFEQRKKLAYLKPIWVPMKAGFLIPVNALVRGNDCRQDVYVIRAHHKGGLIPGKLQSGLAYIPYQGKQIRKSEYEIMIFPPETVKWVLTVNGRVPEFVKQADGSTSYELPVTAIVGGQDSKGQILFIGRVNYAGTVIVGKVRPDRKTCYIAYDGKELKFAEFEVLVVVNLHH